ncbi:hypothetical protein ABGB07_02415 [Micromonosporaceae bacterium B7E4]|jgi:hypothetical protein
MNIDAGGIQHLRAVIYILTGADQAKHERACIAWCDKKRYQVVGLVIDDHLSSRWMDVCRMTTNGEADLIVVYDRNDRPPNRLPRVESPEPDEPPDVPRQRRPRSVRRTRL